MPLDPIIEEMHRVRDEHAKKFDDDLYAMCEDIRAKQAMSARTHVTRPPRKPALHNAA